MAAGTVARLYRIKADIRYVSRAKPREVISDTLQTNSWGVAEIIPDCPECGSKHTLRVVAKQHFSQSSMGSKESRESIEKRECVSCGYVSHRKKVPIPVPPNKAQIEYANQLIRQRYYELKGKYLKKRRTREIPKTLSTKWKKEARRMALIYLKTATHGYPIEKLYPQLNGELSTNCSKDS